MMITDITINIAMIMKLSLLDSVSFFITAKIHNNIVSQIILIVKKRKKQVVLFL